MGKVHQLSQHVANCIAAGEVVENPASVAKELCENAVDAGASEITVSMRGGGIAELVVSDDGCGMSREDAQLCFARHATSKIRSEEDLGGITTLGFRGEALAAISAVSRVTLETCERGAECGTRVVREYGETLAVEDAVIAPGTTFAVRELFRNTPARMKFLRSDSAEGAAVASVVGRLALSHPEVRFTMLRDTKRAFETSGSGDLFQAITDFCGKEFARGLLRLEAAGEGELSAPRVWGYVTSPAAHRATRGMQYFFLNGRAVQSKAIAAALDDAYHGLIPGGRFPGCVLHLALAPELCDINVHPTKLTVKFTRERDVYLAVRRAVRDLLERTQTRPAFDLASPAPETPASEKKSESPAPPASPASKPPAAKPLEPLSSPMPSAPEAAAEERPVQTRIFAPPVWVPPSSGAGFAPVMTFVPDTPAVPDAPAATASELPLAEEAPPPPDD
ncbi:MAG: DNA mismatch repair endonuclease MutL, partial [Eubacteriales bacterium]|nr:DNA mismatch repair endonuclease MutL [Eubacteriales bacterium]